MRVLVWIIRLTTCRLFIVGIRFICKDVHFFFKWIELPWPENPVNNYARHTETLGNFFDFIRSHKQYIPRSHSLEIEPTTTEPKLYNSPISPYRTRVTPNWVVMVIARPVNLNVSWMLHPYSLPRTWSPPGPRLPKRIGNTHPRNYHDLKGKDIDVHFCLFFLSKGMILWIEIPWPENPANTYARHTETLDSLLGLISSGYRDLYHCRSNQRPQIV